MTVFNFVNLVCWRDLRKLYLSNNSQTVPSVFYCDSMSLSHLSRLFGNRVQIFSGIDCARGLVPNNKSLFLGPDSYFAPNFFPVSYLSYSDDISILAAEAKSAITENINIVYIGISSPKQNILAFELQKLFPTLDFYCLGAALGTSVPKGKFVPYWLVFLMKNPRRTWYKLFRTFSEILLITALRSRKNEFREFCVLLGLSDISTHGSE